MSLEFKKKKKFNHVLVYFIFTEMFLHQKIKGKLTVSPERLEKSKSEITVLV